MKNYPNLPEPTREQVIRTLAGGGTNPAESIDLFHWAAVSLIVAATGAVLRFAAGTPGLAEAAKISAYLFAVLGVLLVLAGWVGIHTRAVSGVRMRTPDTVSRPAGRPLIRDLSQ